MRRPDASEWHWRAGRPESLIIGGYYLLTKTFGMDLPELNWGQIWPLFVIALGAGVLWRAWMVGIDRGGPS